jgi:hypothetical protein
MDETRLRPPRRKTDAPIPRSANAMAPPHAGTAGAAALLRRMKRARLVTPRTWRATSAAHLPDGRGDGLGALDIDSIEDLRAYQTLLTLALRSNRRGGLRREDPLSRLLRGFRVDYSSTLANATTTATCARRASR